MPVYFITGIDTEIGKTYATGILARYLINKGESVITQKLVQTGSPNGSDDIRMHRLIMGIETTEDDRSGLTCPCIFKYPSAPHLAAELEGTAVDINLISGATEELSRRYRNVLVEGVGGVYVPLTRDLYLIDYLDLKRYPIILVSSSRLGSINHTLMTLEALLSRGIDIAGIIYNRHDEVSEKIAGDSRRLFKRFLSHSGTRTAIIDMPSFSPDDVPDIDFSPFFQNTRQ